jgi:hypothetical protein
VNPATRLLPQVVLAIAFAGGACAAFASALTLAVGNTDGVDSAVFVLAFGALLPVAVVVLARGGPLAAAEPKTLSTLSVVAAAGLVAALCIARIVDEVAGDELRSSVVVLGLTLAWLAGVAIAGLRARRGLPLPGRDRDLPAWLPLTLLPFLALALTWDALPEPGTFLLSLMLAGALFAAHLLLSPADVLGRAGSIVIDLAAMVAILLLVSDVTVFTPESQAWGLQPHHNTSLGAANDLLGGRSMLVDAYSIYGVGSMYFLGGLFELVPIGYGVYGILAAGGLAVMYAVAYAIVRLAGTSQVVAATAMAAAIVSSVYSTVGSPATFPSLGALRWGFGYLLVLLAVLAARGERWAPVLRIGGAAIVGISSIWSFEVFVYTSATYAAIAAYWAASDSGTEGWLRSLARLVVPAAAACAVAHLALTLWTLAQEGQLPSWDPYLAIVREFVTGPYNRLVAAPWWVGITVGAFLFASAVAAAAIILRLPRFAAANRPALLAIAGLTAFAVATFTYGVRFSSEDYVARFDLSVLAMMALWIHVATRSTLPRPARTALAATGFGVAALLIVGGWDNLVREAGRSPLIAALPGNGRSVESEVSRAWDNPPLQARSAAAETLLDRQWPDQERALVLLHPDLSVEALMRSGRVNELPVSYFLADTIVTEEREDDVAEVVEELQPGTLLLTEGFYLTPGATRDYITTGAAPLTLEQVVLDRLRERFRLEPVERVNVGFDPTMGDDELVVVRLAERR